MPRRIESLSLKGPAGRLEALLEEPEEGEPLEAAVVCHPHPKGGGTMHNKVVYRIARALRRSGCVVLRFNYRGVNLSQGIYDHGIGETDDARVALAELRLRYPSLPLLAAGFSFGSRVALRITSQEPVIERVIAVGFPTTIPDREYVYQVPVLKTFVHSTNDEYGPRPEMELFFASLPQPKAIYWVESQDHFFKDSLESFESVVETIAQKR